MIGITFALPSESSDLARRLQQVDNAGKLRQGKISGREVAIVHTGVGARDCRNSLEFLLHKIRPEFVISSGFAGALDEQMQIGDLILAVNFSDPGLLGRAREILRDRGAQTVKLFTSASIVDSIDERNKIARESGAVAVDMESGSIWEICKGHRVPMLSLRAISDSPRRPLPGPPGVLFDIERQRTSYGRLFAYLLRHPGSIPKVMGFSKRITQVRATLTDALVELIRGL